MKKKVLAIIPARAGSKGIKNKNTRLLNNKELIAHTLDFAKECKLFDKIVISTNDNKIIKKYKDNVIERPNHLSNDESLVIDAVKYTLNYLKTKKFYLPDVIVLLECTSPIRNISDLKAGLDKVLSNQADSSTVFIESDISPNSLWKINKKKVTPFIEDANPFFLRQNQPKSFKLTGQFYVFSREALESSTTISLMIGKVYPIISSSKYNIDIDNEEDFLIAEQIIKNLL